MKVLLLSDDPALPQLCREIAARNPDRAFIILSGQQACGIDADVCIADFPGDPEPPLDFESRGIRQVFLIDRQQLQELNHRHVSPVPFILKPVTRAVLEAFLIPAGDRAEKQTGAAWAGDEDEMLRLAVDTNLALQRYDQDRTNFLVRAVQDFQPPLTALSGYCGLLLAEQLGPLTNPQQEVLERIQNSTRRLTRLASTMFQLTAAHRPEHRAVLKKGDLCECLHKAVQELIPLTDEKRLAISVECESAPEPLHFDDSQMQQVMVTLLDNACRFTPKLGSIDIAGYPYFWNRRSTAYAAAPERRRHQLHAPNAFRVDIRDTGPAIPPEHTRAIFEEFATYAGSRSGGGLGLAVCNMILRQHHGCIWAESSPNGAVFSFVLPFYRPEFEIDHSPAGTAKQLLVSPGR